MCKIRPAKAKDEAAIWTLYQNALRDNDQHHLVQQMHSPDYESDLFLHAIDIITYGPHHKPNPLQLGFVQRALTSIKQPSHLLTPLPMITRVIVRTGPNEPYEEEVIEALAKHYNIPHSVMYSGRFQSLVKAGNLFTNLHAFSRDPQLTSPNSQTISLFGFRNFEPIVSDAQDSKNQLAILTGTARAWFASDYDVTRKIADLQIRMKKVSRREIEDQLTKFTFVIENNAGRVIALWCVIGSDKYRIYWGEDVSQLSYRILAKVVIHAYVQLSKLNYLGSRDGDDVDIGVELGPDAQSTMGFLWDTTGFENVSKLDNRVMLRMHCRNGKHFPYL